MKVIQSLYSRSFGRIGYLSTFLLQRCQLNHAFSAFFVSGQTVPVGAVVFAVGVMTANAALADTTLAEARVG